MVKKSPRRSLLNQAELLIQRLDRAYIWTKDSEGSVSYKVKISWWTKIAFK